MKRDKGVLGSTALMVVLLSVPAWAQAQERPTSYPSMAPVNQYLISDRNAEIAMARSAAPDAISRDAKVLVLGSHGYETAVEGKNSFSPGTTTRSERLRSQSSQMRPKASTASVAPIDSAPPKPRNAQAVRP